MSNYDFSESDPVDLIGDASNTISWLKDQFSQNDNLANRMELNDAERHRKEIKFFANDAITVLEGAMGRVRWERRHKKTGAFFAGVFVGVMTSGFLTGLAHLLAA